MTTTANQGQTITTTFHANRDAYLHACEQALQLCYAIEKLPCSKDATDLSLMASQLRQRLNDQRVERSFRSPTGFVTVGDDHIEFVRTGGWKS